MQTIHQGNVYQQQKVAQNHAVKVVIPTIITAMDCNPISLQSVLLDCSILLHFFKKFLLNIQHLRKAIPQGQTTTENACEQADVNHISLQGSIFRWL